MNLIITLLIFALVVWLVFYILGMLPLPAPIKQIATVVLAVIFLILLLQKVGILGGHWL